MTLTLQLSPELESRLQAEAGRLSMPVDAYALEILTRSLPPYDRRSSAVALLESWIGEADFDEQKETGDHLVDSLDKDRPSDRPLYPSELKGVTW